MAGDVKLTFWNIYWFAVKISAVHSVLTKTTCGPSLPVYGLSFEQ